MYLHTSTLLSRHRYAKVAGACLLALCIAGTTIAGIQGSGLRSLAAFGPVETSGSLIVNGVAYDASNARVVIDGRPAHLSQIRGGHLVRVQGAVSPDGTTAVAEEVVLDSDVRGEITAVDADSGAFRVLGQTVVVTNDSVIDPRLSAGLKPGMTVEVSAFAAPGGRLMASRIEAAEATGDAQVRGVVRALNEGQHTFQINDLEVVYSGAGVAGRIENGEVVEVVGPTQDHGATMLAAHVEVFTSYGSANDDGDVEGLITAFTSDSDFKVNGQPVRADEKTKYHLHRLTLQRNTLIRVRGVFDASGVLIADHIDVKKELAPPPKPPKADAKGGKQPKPPKPPK